MKFFLAMVVFVLSAAMAQADEASPSISITFNHSVHTFSESEQAVIRAIVVHAEERVRALMPSLDAHIAVEINAIDRNLDIVGGVFGRAEAPGVVSFSLSTQTRGGIVGSATSALTSSAFHEFHHLARGWTITDNKFGNPSGIPVATVNEGLASVFADTYTNEYFPEAYGYPEDVKDWLPEVMALPKDASYQHWVGGMHPDGRSAIGYRLGRYVVHQAAEQSGKSILELSEMTPAAILDLVVSAE